MTSCRVVASIARMRTGSRWPAALARTAAAVPAGTVPRASMASQTASSTSSQRAKRAASDHSAAKSGRL